MFCVYAKQPLHDKSLLTTVDTDVRDEQTTEDRDVSDNEDSGEDSRYPKRIHNKPKHCSVVTSVNHTSTRSKGTPAPLVVVASMESINQTCV